MLPFRQAQSATAPSTEALSACRLRLLQDASYDLGRGLAAA